MTNYTPLGSPTLNALMNENVNPFTPAAQQTVAQETVVRLDLAEYTRLLAIEAQVRADAARNLQAPSVLNNLVQPLPAAWTPKIQVEPYDGNPVGPGPHEFLKKAEQLRTGKGIPEDIFLNNWIPSLLTGSALKWYLQSPVITSWDEFKSRLIAKYQMPNHDDVIFERLYARKQLEGEKVSTYVGDMNSLIQRLTRNMPEEEQVRLVYMNMAPALQLLMCTKSYTSLIELVADACKVETRLAQTAVRVDTGSATPAPSRPKADQSKVKCCYNCGLPGHLIAQCSLPRKRKTEQRVSGVRQNNPTQQENESGTQ